MSERFSSPLPEHDPLTSPDAAVSAALNHLEHYLDHIDRYDESTQPWLNTSFIVHQLLGRLYPDWSEDERILKTEGVLPVEGVPVDSENFDQYESQLRLVPLRLSSTALVDWAELSTETIQHILDTGNAEVLRRYRKGPLPNGEMIAQHARNALWDAWTTQDLLLSCAVSPRSIETLRDPFADIENMRLVEKRHKVIRMVEELHAFSHDEVVRALHTNDNCVSRERAHWQSLE